MNRAEPSPTALGVLIPCVDATYLPRKLTDLKKLIPLIGAIVVCFNGSDADYSAVTAAVDRFALLPTQVCRSAPYNKSLAIREGLKRLRSDRVLYTDVDCFIWGNPDMAAVQRAICSEAVLSLLVLRREPKSVLAVRWALFRRRLLAGALRKMRLYYLGFRGGGYIAGDFSSVISVDIYSDDLFFPVEHAAKTGQRVEACRALVFYEADRNSAFHRSGVSYTQKLPRLIYGSFQAFRQTSSRRVRASIAIQKLAKYAAVGLSPILAGIVLYIAGLPLWPVLAFGLSGRLLLRTWTGVYFGLIGSAPRW